MNSKTIARNTVWYGLENAISVVASLVTSIAVARTLGPSRMGYIVYVSWIVTMTSSLGSVGLPATTRKYMAEFLGAGDHATARSIYLRTLLVQVAVATLATLAAVLWVLRESPPDYRVAALLLVLSIWPAMVNFISAQANVAAERLDANLPASAASSITFFIMTGLAVILHWGVIGITAAMLGMRLVDFAVRIVPTFRRVWIEVPTSNPPPNPPSDLAPRMLRFAFQSLTGMLLTLIVWDRSEIFLLKHLSPDIRQLAFYSVALGVAERLLVFPSVFGSAIGASIFAQFGRDRSKLPAMTAASVRYLALSSIPVHLIATPFVATALVVVYGKQYAGAILVATFAPILCLPKAFLGPIQNLFESNDAQKFFLITTVFASFVDLGVAWLLIPSLGALGACIGSGVAQTIAVGLMWIIGIRLYHIQLPWRFITKVSLLSLATAALAYLVVHRLPNLFGLLLGMLVAAVVFFSLAYLFRLLEPEDLARVQNLSTMLPHFIARPVNRAFGLFHRRPEPRSTVA